MSKEINENKIYRYLDRFPDGVTGTYRQLEEELGIDHETIRRIIGSSNDISATVQGIGNSKETFFILTKHKVEIKPLNKVNETKSFTHPKPKSDIFETKKETKEIKFNTRQHKLCDYLLEHCKGKENRIDKVDLLWDLREYYFEEELKESMIYYRKDKEGYPTLLSKETIKKSRHNYAEYVRLTNDISFINKHGEIRQILIGSQGGTKGGVWALRVGEQHDAIDKVLGDALKLLNKFWAMKKAAEKHGNIRLVFKNEKNIMNILRQFDN